MFKTIKQALRRTAAVATPAGIIAAPAAVQAEQAKTIRIGGTAWSDVEAVTDVAKELLE